MNDFQKQQSRISERGRKRKQNRMLNLLIAVVVILIIVVGISVFSGGSGDGGKSSQPTSGESSNGPDNNGSQKGTPGDSDNQNEDDQDQATAGDSSNDESKADDDQQKDSDKQKEKDKDKEDKKKDGGPDGPWKAIGTDQDQEGEHVSSYDKGSKDWDEKVQALLYATGIDGDYTLWRLGNGGSPQKSTGVISSKKNPGKKYEVQLKWLKDKGWKPTSVDVK